MPDCLSCVICRSQIRFVESDRISPRVVTLLSDDATVGYLAGDSAFCRTCVVDEKQTLTSGF